MKTRGRQLRAAAIIVLSAGFISAGIVYWMGTRSVNLSDDVSMQGYDKPQQRQMAMLYGKQGELIEDLVNSLKQPGTQAFIIIAVSVIGAAACFYFARLHDAQRQNKLMNKFAFIAEFSVIKNLQPASAGVLLMIIQLQP